MMYDIYPLTIIADRYGGIYSGGLFTAWNVEAASVPWDIWGNDEECIDFWNNCCYLVGKGDTPEEAVMDLKNKIDGETTAKEIQKSLIDFDWAAQFKYED